MSVHSNLRTHEVEYLFTDKQIAKRLGISRATTWRWVKKGDFPKPIKISDGCTRWRKTDLEKWESDKGIK